MLNLSSILESSAKKYPNKIAFTFDDSSLSYQELNKASNKVANGLISDGIKPGDKVALNCLNILYFPIIYFGILKAGAVVVPLSVLLKKEETIYHLKDSDAKAFFCFEGTDDLPIGEIGYKGFSEVEACKSFYIIMPTYGLPSSIEGIKTLESLTSKQSDSFETYGSSAEDTALIIYTSGTTGAPKGAELTHLNLFQNAIISADITRATSKDIQLIVLPLFHIFAMTALMNAGIYRGTTNVLLPRFDAETVFELMQKHKVSIFAGVPTMYWGLNNSSDTTKFDLKLISNNLKTCISGGASLPLTVLEEFEEKFDVPIIEGYGMSEGSPVVTFNQLDVGRKPGSIGTAAWGVDVKLVDEEGKEVGINEKGELLFRGHNVMKGYYKKPEANTKALKNGWMHSGDIATKDEEGFYYIVDRTKDMIIRGGLNVYPREVEEVMMKHKAISMVAVIGLPSEEKGEEIKACVVLNDGASISEKELINWTKERIAAYKYPRIIEIMKSLPTSATGKILKKELRKL